MAVIITLLLKQSMVQSLYCKKDKHALCTLLGQALHADCTLVCDGDMFSLSQN